MSNPSPPFPEFDQIVKGNVSIRKLSEKKYKITFSKIGKFLMYQVWDKDNVNNMNDKRTVGYIPAKEWVRAFNETNAFLDKNSKPLFTPTTIMETVNEAVYAFVIEKAYFNSNDHVVFIVSTKNISLSKNTSKKLIDIPCGKFTNMRFDIDTPARDSCYFGCGASVVFTLGIGALGFDYCKSTCPT
jgi:hypothetical protein